jgi:chitinase
MNGGTHPGPMLEIAYWIGPNVGVRPTAAQESSLNLQQYRDTTRNRGGTDRWVVFHIHFVPGPNLLRDFEGNTFIGTPSIRMYHGQTASIPQRGAVRVNNQDTGMGINSRSGLVDCPTGSLWYIGMPTAVPSTNDNSEGFTIALQQWGHWLWDNHYVDSLSLQYIFDVHRWGPHNQFDLDSAIPALTLTRSTADVTTYNWRWNPATNLFETGPDVPNS